MSIFDKMFKSRKDGKTISAPEAVQKLRDVEEMLRKKQEFLEQKTAKELQIAVKNGKKNKPAALQALKRKKRYEKQLQQLDGTLSTIEMQREALESANTNTAVLKAMNDAAMAMKSANHNMDADKVHDMLDDVAEQQEVAKEISDAISNPAAFGQDVDEDELEKELMELEAESLLEEMSKIKVNPKQDDIQLPAFPDVPSSSKSRQPARRVAQEDDDDMKELASWAS